MDEIVWHKEDLIWFTVMLDGEVVEKPIELSIDRGYVIDLHRTHGPLMRRRRNGYVELVHVETGAVLRKPKARH